MRGKVKQDHAVVDGVSQTVLNEVKYELVQGLPCGSRQLHWHPANLCEVIVSDRLKGYVFQPTALLHAVGGFLIRWAGQFGVGVALSNNGQVTVPTHADAPVGTEVSWPFDVADDLAPIVQAQKLVLGQHALVHPIGKDLTP